MKSLIFGLLALAAATAQAQDKRCFNGYAYTLEQGAFRYIEHHEQTRVDDKAVQWDTTYYNPDGDVIATKHMDFSDNDTVPVYTLEMSGGGYEEGIRHDDGWTMFRRAGENAEVETKAFEIEPPMAADSGFHPLLQKHFDELMAGQTLAFRFAAAGRQSVIDLRAKRIDDTTFENEKAVVFRAELDMMLVNYFVDSLALTYDPDSKRLLEYRGVGNIQNDEGEVYPVRVSYYSATPEAAEGAGVPTSCTGG